MELGVFLQRGDHVGGNAVGEVQVASLIGGVDGGVVSGEHELDLVDGDLVSIVPVGVLGVGHGLVVLPLGQSEGAVGHEARFGAPGTGLVGGGVGFHIGLLHRQEGGEGSQIQEVSAGSAQNHGEDLAVFRGGNLQIIGIARDAVEHVSVVGSGLRVGSTLPAVDEVVGVQLGAVGPLQIIL